MARFNTSERTVLSALAELQRSGRIVRRAGSGTYVAESPKSYTSRTAPGISSEPIIDLSAADDALRGTTIVVVTAHDNSYLSRGIELAYNVSAEWGVPVTYEPPRQERIDALCLADDGVERGFLLLGSNRFEMAKRIHAMGRRVVFVGGPPEGQQGEFPCVDIDNTYGGLLVARHLIDQGHRHIAIALPISVPRSWGIEIAVREARARGIDIRLTEITPAQITKWQEDVSLVADYFAQPDHPTALCAWNDHDAIFELTLLQSANIRVPDQVSIVGFDNGHEATRVTPALTTIDSRLEDRIRIAVDLLAKPAAQVPSYTATLQPLLVVRASSSPPSRTI
jgi:DNA-binding LacI/PurR family transcriptional regulator